MCPRATTSICPTRSMVDVFVDTSAIYALLVENDENHAAARSWAMSLQQQDARLFTSPFVLLKRPPCCRLGSASAVRSFFTDVLPTMQVVWVDDGVTSAHGQGPTQPPPAYIHIAN